MKTRQIISSLLVSLGLLLAMGTVCIVILATFSAPVILQYPDAASDRAEAMMTAVCSGDYAKASSMLYGTPDFGDCPEDSSAAAKLLWIAFQESLTFDFMGKCYVDDSGLAIDAHFKSLDVTGVLEGLDVRAEALMNRRIESAEDSTEIYDEDNDFRKEIIDEVLRDAVAQALDENPCYKEQTITLRLVFEQGEWWVLPDSELLDALSGAITD